MCAVDRVLSASQRMFLDYELRLVGGDPACRPCIPQLWYWHGSVRQGSDRFILSEEALSPYLFPSRCTYSMATIVCFSSVDVQ